MCWKIHLWNLHLTIQFLTLSLFVIAYHPKDLSDVRSLDGETVLLSPEHIEENDSSTHSLHPGSSQEMRTFGVRSIMLRGGFIWKLVLFERLRTNGN
jgi:hypothetical protein